MGLSKKKLRLSRAKIGGEHFTKDQHPKSKKVVDERVEENMIRCRKVHVLQIKFGGTCSLMKPTRANCSWLLLSSSEGPRFMHVRNVAIQHRTFVLTRDFPWMVKPSSDRFSQTSMTDKEDISECQREDPTRSSTCSRSCMLYSSSGHCK